MPRVRLSTFNISLMLSILISSMLVMAAPAAEDTYGSRLRGDLPRVIEEARPDVFCFHAGTTKGGLTGYDSGETIDETARRTEEANRKLREPCRASPSEWRTR